MHPNGKQQGEFGAYGWHNTCVMLKACKAQAGCLATHPAMHLLCAENGITFLGAHQRLRAAVSKLHKGEHKVWLLG